LTFLLLFSSRSSGVESKSPDDELFKALAYEYSSRNPAMIKRLTCAGESFENGIINGADWYNVKGLYLVLSIS